MKILHCCLAAFYIDNYSYQENILPVEHKKRGFEVKIIASTETFIDNNNLGYIEAGSYRTEEDIPITRLPYSKLLPHFIGKKLRIYKGVSKELFDFKPDIIFLHDLQFLDIRFIKKYAKQFPDTKIYVDCHADFTNSARNWISKNILHKLIYKYCAKQIEPYTSIFWGVLPARCDFLVEVYGIPKEKVKLLVMGAEDEKVKVAKDKNSINRVRKELSIEAYDFLIITGGKIDLAKKQTLLLMDAIKNINNSKLKLLVFGSVAEELKTDFMSKVDGIKIKYIGWLKSDETYKYFGASDLAVFPGRHSVLWEEVVGIGIPLAVKYWKGTTHIDIGGNCIFLHEDSMEEIKDVIEILLTDKVKYERMLVASQEKGMHDFSYTIIAEKSIDMVIEND